MQNVYPFLFDTLHYHKSIFFQCHDGFEAFDVFFGVIHESGSDIDEAISADMRDWNRYHESFEGLDR